MAQRGEPCLCLLREQLQQSSPPMSLQPHTLPDVQGKASALTTVTAVSNMAGTCFMIWEQGCRRGLLTMVPFLYPLEKVKEISVRVLEIDPVPQRTCFFVLFCFAFNRSSSIFQHGI